MKNNLNLDNQDLIIFSYEYPYGYSEVFLENEIKFLSNHFKSIIVIPTRIVWNKNLVYNNKRDLPKNVKVIKETFSPKFFNIKAWINLSIDGKLTLGKKQRVLLKQAIKAAILVGFLKHHKLLSSSILYYSYWKNETATALAYLQKQGDIKKAVSRAHREDLFDRESIEGFKPFDDYVKKYINKVFCISNDGANYLKEKGFESEKVIVSKLGVYQSRGCTLSSPYGFHILTVSNLVSVKRVDLIAKAILSLEMDVNWTHIGGGDQYEKIQSIINERHRPNVQINFLGKKSNAFVLDFYRTNYVDLFLNASFVEGIPVSIMEAYSFSVPSMACNVGGNPEIVDQSYEFLLPKDLDEYTLSEKLTQFYQHRHSWLNFKLNAYNIWNKQYDADRNYLIFVKNLQKV